MPTLQTDYPLMNDSPHSRTPMPTLRLTAKKTVSGHLTQLRTSPMMHGRRPLRAQHEMPTVGPLRALQAKPMANPPGHRGASLAALPRLITGPLRPSPRIAPHPPTTGPPRRGIVLHVAPLGGRRGRVNRGRVFFNTDVGCHDQPDERCRPVFVYPPSGCGAGTALGLGA